MSGSREEGKRAILITGTSTGIGKACALYLDSIGFKVFAGVRREADGNALRKKRLRQTNPGSHRHHRFTIHRFRLEVHIR